MMKKGVFISFEGGEGVGKSTNIQFCADWLKKQNIDSISTREPGGTEIGELIREQLLKAQHDSVMQPMTELLLVLAARTQHIEEVIKPALAKGTWVLCDRFIDSTLAYQGYARELNLDLIERLAEITQTDFMPTLTFLLDAPLAVSLARTQARGEKTDRFESENQRFFQQVRAGFLALANQHPRIKKIDASQNLEQIQAQLIEHLQPLIKVGPNEL